MKFLGEKIWKLKRKILDKIWIKKIKIKTLENSEKISLHSLGNPPQKFNLSFYLKSLWVRLGMTTLPHPASPHMGFPRSAKVEGQGWGEI